MKFYIYTLGCKVNYYETEVMKDILLSEGFKEASSVYEADVCIINTCSVTNTADQKSLKVVRSTKRKNPKAIIVVVGCLIQSRTKEMRQIEGVHIILGNRYKTKIATYINEYLLNHTIQDHTENIMKVDFEPMRVNHFSKTRAFVKIQDGCNHFCTYCIIPYTRGNVRSKKREDVLSEIQNLVLQGHKEIVLTGIHTGNYGAEIGTYVLSDLLSDILKISDLLRVRLSSIEMNEINSDILNLMKQSQKIANHLHVPLQSGSNEILKWMNRKYSKEDFIEKINKIREVRLDISITTDVIVGFPGETEAHFEETIDTITKIGFTKLHVFPYSKRNGTRAATLENQIDDITKKRRVKVLLELSKKLEMDYMKKFIGKDVSFISEEYKDGYIIGHTSSYLLVKTKGSIRDLHKVITVHISALSYPYVIGNICKNYSYI